MQANKRIRLKVASPCTADWNSMKGDDAVRHCGSCNKKVYQLSAMTTEQVESLLASGPTCGRFYQRKDGTLLTEDCVVGLRRKRRKQAVVGAGLGVLSALGVAVGAIGPLSSGGAAEAPAELIEVAPQPVPLVIQPSPPDEVIPDPEPEDYQMIMGDIAYEEFPETE